MTKETLWQISGYEPDRNSLWELVRRQTVGHQSLRILLPFDGNNLRRHSYLTNAPSTHEWAMQRTLLCKATSDQV